MSNAHVTRLRRAISDRSARIGVIGLGYVGLPLAALFAEAGFRILGVDTNGERVRSIASGGTVMGSNEPEVDDLVRASLLAETLRVTTSYDALSDMDIVLISVETPVDEGNRPHYAALESACRSLGAVLRPGRLVIVESTIAPGTMDRLVIPMISGPANRAADSEILFGHCPERVMPGRLVANLRSLSRVCGGRSPEIARLMVGLYGHVVRAELDVADLVTAELVKTAENAYRDVNIAFANEVALVAEATGADIRKVRELVNKSPGRLMLEAGAGVGGHCIPKDPWLLASPAIDAGIPMRLVAAARAVNDGMPEHVAELVVRGLAERGRSVGDARVVVLGYSYLPDHADTRNSPSIVLVRALERRGATVLVHDPHVPHYDVLLEEAARSADALVLMVAHRSYGDLDLTHLRTLMRTPVLVDGRRVIDPNEAGRAGFDYLGVGLSRSRSVSPLSQSDSVTQHHDGAC